MGSSSRAAWLLGVSILAAAGAAPAQVQSPSVIPTSVRDEAVDPERPLRVALYGPRFDWVAEELDGPAVVEQNGERVVLRLVGYPGRRRDDPAAFRDASFLVDYDEAVLVELTGSVRERFGERPTSDQLVALTREIIAPSSERGWDSASQIVKRRIGDCTEHAVLFAALSRSFGRPTRIMNGIVVASLEEGGFGAFGHAWNEVHDGTAWRLVDATPIQGVERVWHVPHGAMRDEGPGYGIAMFETLGVLAARVEILGNAAEPEVP